MILPLRLAVDQDGNRLFGAAVDAAIADRAVSRLRNAVLCHRQVLNGAGADAFPAADAIAADLHIVCGTALNLRPKRALALAEQNRNPVKSALTNYSAGNIRRCAINSAHGSAQHACIFYAVSHGKQRKITQVVRHANVFRIDHVRLPTGQQRTKRVRAVAGEDELRCENNKPFASQRGFVRVYKLPHGPRHARAIDWVAKRNRVLRRKQRFHIQRLLDGIARGSGGFREVLRDKTRVSGSGKIEYDHGVSPVAGVPAGVV